MNNLKLEILALCDYSDISKSGKFNIVGIFDEIYSDHFPTTFVRAFLALTVTGEIPNSKSNLTFEVISPDKKVILKGEMELPIGGNGKGNFRVELIGLPLPQEGIYTIPVYSGSKILGSTTFNVIKTEASKNGIKKSKFSN